MSEPRIIPKGTVFLVSEGSYSDYEVCAIMRAMLTFDMDAVLNECLETNELHRKSVVGRGMISPRAGTVYSTVSATSIVTLLHKRGFATELPMVEVRLADEYGRDQTIEVYQPPPEPQEAPHGE